MKRLLLIEDDLNTREGLADLLRLDGHWVQAVNNGRAGLKLAGMASFDVLLCDYKLPDMNGLEVCRRSQKLHGHLEFFLLTAYNNAEINRAAKNCGVGKIFYKPLDLDDLFMTLVSTTAEGGSQQRPCGGD
jgi:two-component system response regulator HydG